MSFLNIPLKSVQLITTEVLPIDTMPWYSPLEFPVAPGNPAPAPYPKAYRWLVTCDVLPQTQSSYQTRLPGAFNGQDIAVGQWIANTSTGSAWQIISITSKSAQYVQFIVQDVYRYNTAKDSTQQGDGAPPGGYYVAFSVSDAGTPVIDPVPESGVSANFFTNLLSRFEYINLQYDFPLYQAGNNFQINDVIGTDSSTNTFVLASNNFTIPIGRVTSISDTIIGWFTINPVQKITDFLDELPGSVGDIIYTDVNNPGKLTLQPGGSQIYLKIRDNTQSVSYSNADAVSTPGSVFQLNGVDVTVQGAGDLTDLVSATELVASQTGVNAIYGLAPAYNSTDIALITPAYGEPVLNVSVPYPTATIDGVLVTFDISSTDSGYSGYARAADMKTAINRANIPNVTADTIGTSVLVLTNSQGAAITIVNVNNDINGVPFAGASSGSGLALSTPASLAHRVTFLATDSRPIDFLDVVGSPSDEYGLNSVENGVKACGMYIAEGIRVSVSTVVANLAGLYSLTPYVGDQAYVIDSNDGNGNSAGEWSLWIYDGTGWIQTSNQDSATTDAKSLEYMLTIGSPSEINISEISTGRRITLITIEVLTPFNSGSTVSIGYQVNNPLAPPAVPAGLMPVSLSDLTIAGTYSTSTDVLFGTDTEQGDVTITANFAINGATEGSAQIIVSYV